MNAHSRYLLLAVALTASSVVFFQCSGSMANCSADNCSGCCDANGTCKSGASNTVCGKNATSCVDCTSSGMACISQVCKASGVGGGNGGGSSMGGGNGGGGGGGGSSGGGSGGGAVDAGCLKITMVAPTSTFGGYLMSGQAAPYDQYATGITRDPSVAGAPMGNTSLWVEVWNDGNGNWPTFPAMRTFDTSTTYNGCDVCVGLSLGCDSMGMSCMNDLFSQGGMTTVTEADQNPYVGRVTGTGTMLKFVEWDFQNDLPQTNGICVELTSFTMDNSWNNPVPDGGLDGGTDGGTPDDGGMSDAGPGLDAGPGTDGGSDGGIDDGGTSADGGQDAG
jgi:hypothetical protein